MVMNNPFFGMTIVIIDDDPNSLDIAQILLEVVGAQVTTAVNGLAGLKVVEKQKPQLVISDLSMPVMDGWAVMRHIKADENLKDIPVVALTAHAMAGDREKILEAGFYKYMPKPLSPISFTKDLLTLLKELPLFAKTSSEG